MPTARRLTSNSTTGKFMDVERACVPQANNLKTSQGITWVVFRSMRNNVPDQMGKCKLNQIQTRKHIDSWKTAVFKRKTYNPNQT